MKIGVIAPLFFPLPPKTYGGTELVVYNLGEGLVKKGHEVTLFACKGSKVSAKLDQKWNEPLNIKRVGTKGIIYQNNRLDYITSISDQFDIIHNHDAIFPILVEEKFKCSFVTTWHSSFFGYNNYIKNHPQYKKRMMETKFISISNSQRKGLPGGKFMATVYNGTVDFNDYKLGRGGEYLVWLGRFNDYKGPVDAIKVALKAKEKLILAGSKISRKQKNYFNKSIKKYIDHKKIEYIGEVNLKQKVKLLKLSSAFLMPIHWEEPFGLVMIEAMACGTPVIAYNRGSVPEIIEDGKNGFIVEENDIDGMVKAVEKIDTIDRKYCRESVKKRFSIEKMVVGYEEVYKKIIADYKKKK